MAIPDSVKDETTFIPDAYRTSHNIKGLFALARRLQTLIIMEPGTIPNLIGAGVGIGSYLQELADDISGFQIPAHGYLQHWAEQGVLLLNTVLTVRAHQAHSHAALGWEMFTDKVIRQLAEHREHLVFILWGSHAQKKGAFIDRQRHLVLTSPHPSPLSAYRGFFGSKPFSRANAYLQAHGQSAIDWQV